MTVSSGFFNSVNHDRLYDAEQLSSIFDGIIIDGVYENYGEAFMVTANPEANSSVIIGTGRAWFDHTWTVNDSQFAMQLDPPNELVERYDAIVIDVDNRISVRKNSIIYVKGSEGSDSPPALIHEDDHNQYPLAYIHRPASIDSPISQTDINIQVGDGDCPVVIGILESQNLENLWQQLDSEFNTWWDGIKETLDENVATNLQNQIDAINEQLNGSNSLVGLLEKPVAEKFMSGQYDVQISSHTIPKMTIQYNTDKPYSTALDPIVFAMPNGYVCRIAFYNDQGASCTTYLPYTGQDRYTNTETPNYYSINVAIYNLDGVKITDNAYTYTPPDNILSMTESVADSALYVVKNFGAIPINLDSFPVTIGVPEYFGWGRYRASSNANIGNMKYGARLHTFSISASGTVQRTVGDLVFSENVSGYIKIFSGASYNQFNCFVPSSTLARLNDGSYILVARRCESNALYLRNSQVGTSSGNQNVNDGTNGGVIKITSDGIVQAPITTLNQFTPGCGDNNAAVVTSRLYTDSTGTIYVLPDNGQATHPSGKLSTDRFGYTTIDPLTLTATIHTELYNNNQLVDDTVYKAVYGAETYSVDEKTGVSIIKSDKGGTSSGEIETLYDNYFIGASNKMTDIVEGSFVGVKSSTGILTGILSDGTLACIGTNGGCAMLNQKLESSVEIDFNSIVQYLKGFVNTDTFAQYVLCDRVWPYIGENPFEASAEFPAITVIRIGE